MTTATRIIGTFPHIPQEPSTQPPRYEIFLAPMQKTSVFSLLLMTLMLPDRATAVVTGERRAVVFYTAETHGTLEPCGCTSDPLGDFARVSALVRGAGGHAALLVDAGSLAYPITATSEKKQPAAELRAEFLAHEIAKLPFGGAALGDGDLERGPASVAPKRLAVNLAQAPFIEPSRIATVGAIKIGILGIVDPTVAAKAGLSAQDPTVAAQQEVARLRAAGAEVIVLLAPVERQLARNLARTTGADFVIVGKNVGQGMARAERVGSAGVGSAGIGMAGIGSAFVVAPAEELQRVGRLDIVLRSKGPRLANEMLVDAGGATQTKDRVVELDRLLERAEADLVRWQKDASSDPAFLAGKVRERDELRDERASLGNGQWKAPASGSYFTNALIPIRRVLPRDPTLSASMHKLDRAIGAANLRAAEPPVAAEPGRASYVGDDKCVSCHKPAARFWKRTVHAQAWKTLVEVGKEAHDDCGSCHVTGYGEIGGTSLGYTKGLQDIQCEVCHGPGSIHIEKRGKESPFAGRLKTPESVCVRCHNEKHSDTFQYQAYLRDVIGPGHGEDARDELGAGPTGKSLRHAAQVRARANASKRAP